MHATPTTTTGATTTTVGLGSEGPPTTAQRRTGPEHLGPCPKTDPNTDLTKLNAGVNGLDRVLVPITALRVRVCLYGGQSNLEGEGTLVLPNVARFEAEANLFPA